ncbi:C4-dicarboxylate ABC transporter [Actinomadura darangshiensis]|uniref:C4-dicarboxylate ABC transporter n=1 Tax=Actinomadura darangshiensis TaxID=705336 RepID=A0A4R5AG28_9ACTN|nr:SLC13 family permease [Actinomadura darangshiensis]TDD70316.1 C4-dicarboxylate ABC transporter [Actinomadura darangshiensis]
MSTEVLSVIVLLAVFAVGTFRPVNLGALALVATFALGLTAAGEDFDTLLKGFPVDVLILLVGVTYLFGIATVNGTIDWIVTSAARLVRGNRAVIPWLLFFVAAIPTTAGAAGPACVALLAPIAVRMAGRHRLDPRLAGLMVINGSNSGNFSPLNVLGVIVNGTVERNGLDVGRGWLWLGNFVVTIALGAACFAVFGGLDLVRRTRPAEAAPDAAPGGPGGAVPQQETEPAPGGLLVEEKTEAPPATRPLPLAATLTAIVAVAVGALVFDQDIGMLALIAAVALHLVLPGSSAGAQDKISWSTVLLICGIVTYVELMQRMGTVKWIGQSVADIDAALLAALLLCFIAALVSAFASSIGVLGAMIPLAVPFLHTGGVGQTGMVIALAVCATAVDATPFSSMGALTVASAPERDRSMLYRGLVRWGFSMVVVAPLTTWLVFIVI